MQTSECLFNPDLYQVDYEFSLFKCERTYDKSVVTQANVPQTITVKNLKAGFYYRIFALCESFAFIRSP
jgi:hypothetical protein